MVISYMWSREVMIIDLIVGEIKKILFYKMSYFPEPCSHSKKKWKLY